MTKTVGILTALGLLAVLPAHAATQKPAAPAAAKTAAAPRVVTLGATETMKFEPATIQAKAGERLRVVLKPTGTMPKIAMAHNFVILKPGASIDKFVMMAGMARDHGYLPPQLKDQVLVATEMIGANQVSKVTFTAPAKPGTYTYFCTFPAHYAGGMKGTLVVK